MLLLTAVAGCSGSSVPDVTAVLQASAAMLPFTASAKLQLCPPIVMGNVAVPEPLGVPDMLKVRLPSPVAKTPWARVAVSPVTPVDGMLSAGKEPPSPLV